MKSNEISQIFEALKRASYSEKKASLFSNKNEKWIVIMIGTVFLAAAMLVLIYQFYESPYIRLFGMILIVSLYILILIWQLFTFVPIFKFLVNPSKDFIEEIEKNIIRELAAMVSLGSVSVDSISYVSNRIELSSSQLEHRMSIFLGAVEKIGILPGFLAALIALSKIDQDLLGSNISVSIYEYIAIGFAIFYTFYFISVFVSQRLKVYAGLLNHYIKFNANKIG